MRIEFDGVSFSYGEKVILSELSFTAEQGEVVCLVGGSGSGKTTALKLALGLLTPSSGNVTAPKRISAVFQEDRLFESHTLKANISCVAANGDRSDELIRLAGLGEFSDTRVSKLSGGQKRRAAILRALNFAADALVLDEPFNGIDAENREVMAKLILEYAKDIPVLLVSHDPLDRELLGAREIEIKR